MSENTQPRTLREIARVVATRFRGMVIVFMLVVGAVALATYLAPRWYRSEVKLEARPSRMLSQVAGGSAAMRDEISLFVVMQREIIMSNYVLASAAMRLDGIEIRPPVAGPDGIVQPWYSDRDVAAYIEANHRRIKKIHKRVRVITPGGQQASFAPSFTIRVDWPEEPGDGSAANARKRAAENAQKMADYLKEAYLSRYIVIESRRTGRAASFFENQSLGIAARTLKKAQDAKERFVKETLKGDLLQVMQLAGKGAGMETGTALLGTQFKGKIYKIDEQIAVKRALLAAINTELARKSAAEIAVPDAVTEANPVLATMQTQMVSLRLGYNVMEPKYTEDHQQLIQIKSQLVLAEKDLRNELVKQATRMSQDIAVLEASRATLDRLVAADRASQDRLAALVATFERLDEDVKAARRSYNAETERANTARTNKMLAADPVQVTVYDTASRPDPQRPRRPIVLLNMLIAFIGGLVLSLTYAFMADHFDHSIKSPADAMRHLDVPVLASVPTFRKQFIRSD